VTAETRYARAADGTHVAYQLTGDGPLDILWLRAWHSNIEHEWAEPVLARILRRLGAVGRVIRLDQRGTGLSDRIVHRPMPTIEDRADDIRAVLAAAGSRRAVLIGLADGGVLCAAFAAMHPEMTDGLVLYHLHPARGWDSPDPGPDDPLLQRVTANVREGWGTEPFAAQGVARNAPSRANDRALIAWLAEDMRLSGTAEDAVALLRISYDTDVRAILPTIHVPTLVLTRGGPDRTASRAVADAIAGARYEELPGDDHMLLSGDTDAGLRAITGFIEAVGGLGPPDDDEADRVLATLLMTDIVGSTALATELGDRRWAALVADHEERIRTLLARHRGQEIDTAGDGFLAAFDGPGRAIRCALAAATAVRDLGIEIRAGVHAGEVERDGPKLRGIAVHIAARIASEAGPSEVLVSRTVRDLVAGSGLEFDDRGVRPLKGVSGEWGLYAARPA
jgi:class 3 adenylate cyclase/alpha-beta hydrolase superfamily lysophospholipase